MADGRLHRQFRRSMADALMFGLGLVAYLRWQRALRAAHYLVLAFGVGAATTVAVRARAK